MLRFQQQQHAAAAAASSPPPFDLSCQSAFPSLVPSPVDSFLGSSETESDDDQCSGYIAKLAEQIAHSMLEDEEEHDSRSPPWASERAHPAQSESLSASPHSTLVGVGCCGWECSDSCSGSSSSEALKPSEGEYDHSWSLLYPATGEEDRRQASSVAVLLPARASSKRLQQPVVTLSNTVFTGGSSHSSACSSESKSASYCAGKSQLSNLQWNSSGVSARNEERGAIASQHLRASNKHGSTSWGVRASRPLPHPNRSASSGRGKRWEPPQRLAWGATSSQQQQQRQHPVIGGEGSGMRAIFLGVTGSRESGGTGVFLPRRSGYGRESAKKPACSTVFLPARVVQAMNLNVEGILSSQVSTSTAEALSGRDVWPIPGSSSDECTQNGWCSAMQEVTPEISLPTEWTY